MNNGLVSVTQGGLEQRIFTVRRQQVMLDRDLAELYGVETKVLNQAVKRNLERFPEYFCFQLTNLEKNELVTICDRFETLKHSSTLPYAFTEQGVAMLSAVLRSATSALYHLGASLKDLGKKWFAFTRMDASGLTVMGRLKEVGYGG